MKKVFSTLVLLILIVSTPGTLLASPWAEQEGYWAKTRAKFKFGLKNSLFGWTNMFMEPYLQKYTRPWEGFCYGAARSVFYTGNGLIHLATFPIPVDFPNIGQGLHKYPAGEMVPNIVEHQTSAAG